MLFLKNNRSQFQKNEPWKTQTNSIIVTKNILNQSTNTSSNNIENMKWPTNCELKAKYKFNPNPIKHFRKQYAPANSFSNSSMVGFLDKPGNYIVTTSNSCINCGNENAQNINIHFLQNLDTDPQLGDWSYDTCLNKMVCTSCNPQSMIIKRATTVLDKKYSSSNREYLYSKCKTFDQNALQTQDTISCNNHEFGCNPVIQYTNRNYETTGPITSSSSITALKYGCSNPNNSQCRINKEALQNPGCIGCINDNKIRRKRINILH